MIQSFRKFFQSTIGVALTLAFLGLIAFAFASMDVANTSLFGGVSGAQRVAIVGGREIGSADLSSAATNRLENLRQQDPTLTMQAMVAQGGIAELLDQMISRWAIAEFAESIGLRAGNRLVDSEIATAPGFRGVDGNFDPALFRAALAQRRLSEAAVREDLAMGLLARQLIVPTSWGARLPESLSSRYARLLAESRTGSIAVLPAEAFAPAADPTPAQLQAYYDAHRDNYIRPERRVIRYASFGIEAIGEVAPPSEEMIARRYQRDITSFQPSERRRFTQLVLPTRAAAQAVIDEVRGGISLEASARAKGLATSTIADTDEASLAAAISQAAAQAGFAAAQGTLAGPVQGALGWYVLRVDGIERRPGISLEQARPALIRQLTEERRREMLNEATSAIEDAFASGASLDEVAREYRLTPQATPPITAAGVIYGRNEQLSPMLRSLVPVAFEMEEGRPQIAEPVPGEVFVMFEVSSIAPSATAPLAEITAEVTRDWRRSEGLRAAGEAAERVLERVRAGQSLAAALGEEQRALPRVQQLTLDRRELGALGPVPPTLMLMFSMAEGTTKRFAPPGSDRWFVVQLAEINAPELPADSELLPAAARQLASTAGEEYVEQLVRAVQQSLRIETNQQAVDAVIAQLTGQGN